MLFLKKKTIKQILKNYQLMKFNLNLKFKMIEETENQLNIWNNSLKIVNFSEYVEWKNFRFESSIK